MGSGFSKSSGGAEAAAAAAQAAEIFKVIDINGDHKLTVDELILAARDADVADEWTESRIKNTFSSFDTNKDDYLDEKEFSAALAAIAKVSKNKQPRGKSYATEALERKKQAARERAEEIKAMKEELGIYGNRQLKAEERQAIKDRLDAKEAAIKAEADRIKSEKAAKVQAEAARIAAEKAEKERIEAERIAAEKAEAERIEAERIAAANAEAERIAAQEAEAKRIAAEKAEADRLAIEQAAADAAEPLQAADDSEAVHDAEPPINQEASIQKSDEADVEPQAADPDDDEEWMMKAE